MKIFALMPFQDEFDDVHHIIKDAVAHVATSKKVEIECYRADEISEPGRISDQILEAIREADLVIADLTGNNPNVMYELGYAHALNVPAIIMNQTVHDSPFDVKDFRQITYERTRLLKDCRPALIASISAVLAGLPTSPVMDAGGKSASDENAENRDATETDFIVPSDDLVATLQTSYLKLKLLKSKGDKTLLQQEGQSVRNVLDKVTVVGRENTTDLRNAIGVAGNCAVQLESAKEFKLAESIWRKAIGLDSEHLGVHIQYADFLIDLGRTDEAIAELKRAKELDPSDERISRLETKFAFKFGDLTEDFGEAARKAFEANPSDRICASAYLMYLDAKDSSDEFEAVCMKWKEASGDSYTPLRALADHLAGKPDSNQRAKDLYESMLENLSGDDRVHVLHNLASIHASTGNNDQAKKHWEEAYRLDRSHGAIRASFSQLLSRMNENETALKVATGESLGNA